MNVNTTELNVQSRKKRGTIEIKMQLYIAMLVLLMFSQLIAYTAYTLDPGGLILYQSNFWIQGIYGLVLSVVVASIIFFIPYKEWYYIFCILKRTRYILSFIVILALAFLLTPWAPVKYGAKRWLFGFQISDIAKLAALILVTFSLEEIWSTWKKKNSLSAKKHASTDIIEGILSITMVVLFVLSFFLPYVPGIALTISSLALYVLAVIILERKSSGISFFYMSIMFSLMYLLILFEPDISTSSLFAVWFLMMLMLWYGRKGFQISLTIMVGIVVLASWLRLDFILEKIPSTFSHAIDRILVWKSPFVDPNGISYHIVKNYLAVFKGGLWGSYPVNIAYVPPVPWSDAILPFVSISMGVIFEFLLVILWIAWGMFFLVSGLRIKGTEGVFVSGFALWFLLQLIFNMLSTYDVFPPTGISVPFLSWGKTGLIIFTIMNSISGVLVSLHWQKKTTPILKEVC